MWISPTGIQSAENEAGIFLSWPMPDDTGYGDRSLNLTAYRIDISLCDGLGACTVNSKIVTNSPGVGLATYCQIPSTMLPQTAATYSLTVFARNLLGWSRAMEPVDQDYK
jgi:hypothetical protein